MLAFTNALLVWVGSLFYYYSKYGYYRVEDIVDLFVTVVLLSAAFGISYFALSAQFKVEVLDLQSSLDSLDDPEASNISILEQVKKKKRFTTVLATRTPPTHIPFVDDLTCLDFLTFVLSQPRPSWSPIPVMLC